MRGMQVRVAAHVCGSLSTVVCSSALAISDARQGTPAADSALPVVTVGQLDARSSGFRYMDSLGVHGRSDTSSGTVGLVLLLACEDPWSIRHRGESHALLYRCGDELPWQCVAGAVPTPALLRWCMVILRTPVSCSREA